MCSCTDKKSCSGNISFVLSCFKVGRKYRYSACMLKLFKNRFHKIIVIVVFLNNVRNKQDFHRCILKNEPEKIFGNFFFSRISRRNKRADIKAESVFPCKSVYRLYLYSLHTKSGIGKEINIIVRTVLLEKLICYRLPCKYRVKISQAFELPFAEILCAD